MRAVSILRRWLSPSLKFVHTARLYALWRAVEAAASGGVLSLTAMGRASSAKAQPKHRIKAMDRLLGNPALQEEVAGIYAAVASLIVRHEQPVILVDWTQVGSKHWALVAAVPIGGRALPICAQVHPAKRLGSVRVHSQFLQQLWGVLPEGCRPVLVSDAGFTTTWFDAVSRMGWDYVGRVRGQRCVRPVGTEGWIANKSLHAQATTTARDLGIFEISRMHRRPSTGPGQQAEGATQAHRTARASFADGLGQEIRQDGARTLAADDVSVVATQDSGRRLRPPHADRGAVSGRQEPPLRVVTGRRRRPHRRSP